MLMEGVQAKVNTDLKIKQTRTNLKFLTKMCRLIMVYKPIEEIDYGVILGKG